MLIACVFAVVGGYTDIFAYLEHGNVFANAQTGNIVLLVANVANGHIGAGMQHVPPLIAFIFGAALANLIGVQPRKRSFRATLICQAIEIVTLLVVALTNRRTPDQVVVPIISFVAALQSTSFSRIGSWSFSSAMTTGNIRTAVTGSVQWALGRNRAENGFKAIGVGSIACSFALGALIGGAFVRLDDRFALIPCAVIAAIGFALTYRERKQLLAIARR